MMLDGCGWCVIWAVCHVFELASSFKALSAFTSTVEWNWDAAESGMSNLWISQYITRCNLKISWISSGCQFSFFSETGIIYFAVGYDWRHLSTAHTFRENAFFLALFSFVFWLLDSKHCGINVRMLWLISVHTENAINWVIQRLIQTDSIMWIISPQVLMLGVFGSVFSFS